LILALVQDNLLWAILQPYLMSVPRQWSEFDRLTVLAVVERLKPLVLAYVNAAGI